MKTSAKLGGENKKRTFDKLRGAGDREDEGRGGALVLSPPDSVRLRLW